MFRLNIQRSILLLLCQWSILANAAPDQATVTCKVYNNKGSAVFLYKVENGEAVSLGFRRPGKMDTCMFSFPMEKEGVYFIRKGGAHLPGYNYVLYLKPGDNKLVDIYTSNVALDFDSCKVKRPNEETVVMQQWTNLFNSACNLGINRAKRDEYIVAYNKLLEQATALKKQTVSSNRYFKQLFALKLDADIQYAKAAAFFQYGERMNAGVDTTVKRKPFYQTLAEQRFCNAGLLQSEHGLTLLKYSLGYQLFQKYGTQEQMLATSFADKMKMICNDTLRAVYALHRMNQITNYEQFKTDILPFKSLFAAHALQQAYQKKVDELTVYAKGAPAYNFTLNNTKDQPVSLSDFRGKVVVLDVWAMWCGACLQEKPFFQQVEEAFKDRNDIVFIGISHDGLARKEVWKKFVAKNGYKNIELLANYNESIGEYYKIEGIPRFMIFDKEGNIVTVDAPRPSDPAFKKLIEQTLNASAAVISGKVLNLPVRSGLEISLQNVEDGALVSRNIVKTSSDGSFEIPCNVEREGFYYLSSVRWRVRVYLKPGDKLQMDVDHKTGRPVSLSGSIENQALYEWQQLISPITSYGYNLSIVSADSIDLDEYIHTYQQLQPAIADFSSKLDKTNAQFAKALQNAMDVDRQLAPINFLLHKSAKKVKGFQPRPKDFNAIPDFYRQFIQTNKFNSASILNIGEAREFMALYAKLNVALLPEEEREKLSPGAKLQLMMNTISNDILKSFFFNDQMSQIAVNNLSEFKETFEPLKKYAKTLPAKETYDNIYSLFSADTTFIGKTSYNFSLPDTSGKMVSMKDFKGKVVFIDVWATWCGPCRAQFPFLKQIEEEYAGNKDIVFVGISLDKVEVKQKWKDMIVKEHLVGIQLLDDFGKAFGRKYDVNAIPRFMLIDKQGNWMEIRCPNPESKADLKRYLDKALKG
jgi:thiol-disulfide isomerase/thioredoxin